MKIWALKGGGMQDVMPTVTVTVTTPTPAAAALLALMPATLLAVAVLTSIPSRTAGQRPVIDSMRTD